jgi:hypothetical protein
MATVKRDLIYGPIMLLRGQTIEVEVVERDGPWIPDPDITYAYIYVATANDGSEESEAPKSPPSL